MHILTESFWPDPEPAFDAFPPGMRSTLGLAIDVGTTTVVLFLEELTTHRNLGVRSLPNPQQASDDLISSMSSDFGTKAKRTLLIQPAKGIIPARVGLILRDWSRN